MQQKWIENVFNLPFSVNILSDYRRKMEDLDFLEKGDMTEEEKVRITLKDR